MSNQALFSGPSNAIEPNKALTLPELLKNHKIIAVLEILDEFDAVPVADALAEGGIECLEVTLRTPAALSAVEIIKNRAPGTIVGAGTVRTCEQLKQAINAGADFAVSPGVTQALLQTALDKQFPYMPGVLTPSDIMLATEYQFNLLKFFPAVSSGGVKALKSFERPFQGLKFCPTGGLNEDNMGDFLELNNVSCIGGGWIVRMHDIYSRRWGKITERARLASSLASSAPTPPAQANG